MNSLELKIPPLALVIIVAAAMWATSRFEGALRWSVPGAAWLAGTLALLGMLVAGAGVVAFRKAGTTVDPRVPEESAALVVSGVYRYSRNPMYVGFVLLLCGWALFSGSVLALLFIPAFIAYLNRFQITPEERFMREKFGESYARYSRCVRRWI